MQLFFLFSLIIAFATAIVNYDDCKRDCHSDWKQCATECESRGNPYKCQLKCQNNYYFCLEGCPFVSCLSKCSKTLEYCRQYSTDCEKNYDSCKNNCEETYTNENNLTGREDL